MAAKNARLKRKCKGKDTFPTSDAAWAAIGGRNRGVMVRMKPYDCKLGGRLHWHYGHGKSGLVHITQASTSHVRKGG